MNEQSNEVTALLFEAASKIQSLRSAESACQRLLENLSSLRQLLEASRSTGNPSRLALWFFVAPRCVEDGNELLNALVRTFNLKLEANNNGTE